jgi:hypothetical protein
MSIIAKGVIILLICISCVEVILNNLGSGICRCYSRKANSINDQSFTKKMSFEGEMAKRERGCLGWGLGDECKCIGDSSWSTRPSEGGVDILILIN